MFKVGSKNRIERVTLCTTTQPFPFSSILIEKEGYRKKKDYIQKVTHIIESI